MSQFDIVANQIMQEALLLSEMPVKKLKGPEAYKFDPSHATYSAFSRKPTSLRSSAEGTDPYNEELQNKIVIHTIKKILDDLDAVGGESEAAAKDYQYKIAEFVRQTINELIPGSLKPAEKGYTAQDGYAARAILTALQEQGIIATERNKAKEAFDKVQETPGALKQAVKDVAATPEVKVAVADDIKASVEVAKAEDLEKDVEDGEDLESEEPVVSSSAPVFDIDSVYSLSDNTDLSGLNDMEKYALGGIEEGQSGEEIVKTLSKSLRLRDKTALIPKLLGALVSKGFIIPKEGEEYSRGKKFGDSGTSAEDVAKELKFGVPKIDPYTGNIE